MAEVPDFYDDVLGHILQMIGEPLRLQRHVDRYWMMDLQAERILVDGYSRIVVVPGAFAVADVVVEVHSAVVPPPELPHDQVHSTIVLDLLAVEPVRDVLDVSACNVDRHRR